jgi:5-methylcytosine-specific restriction endonuclease McrA
LSVDVLVLNSTYEPLNICSWKRAVVLLVKGKAVAVEENCRDLGAGYRLPLVIRLSHYVRVPHKAIPLTRRNVLHRDNYTCQYCGTRNNLTLDHVFPRSRGGKDTWDNVVTACLKCNVKKGNKTPIEAGMALMTAPNRPHHFMLFELSKHRRQQQDSGRYWDKYLFF